MAHRVLPIASRPFALLIGLVVASMGPIDPSVERPRLKVVLQGTARTELAPHGAGNVYAPEVLFDGGVYRMWYGGQGKDGHDRIHLAESRDGETWTRRGVVIDRGAANHVNDPSVVKVDGTYYLYYTLAAADVVDEIALATSRDGTTWALKGVVLRPGAPEEWDGLLVGRPSVLYEDGVFKMWYDGRKDLGVGAPARGVPKSATSRRSVGFATSKDGLHWTRHPGNPVFGHDAGGVDVERTGRELVMVYESGEGTKAAVSLDGTTWLDRGLWAPRTGGDADRSGQVTPMLFQNARNREWALFVGAARTSSWDHNQIATTPVPSRWFERLLDQGAGGKPR